MENTTGTKKRGRPRKDSAELKRHNVTIAMAAPIREAIQRAADENGRSVSSEIDFRLGMSLALDKDTGRPSVRRLVDFTRLAATKIVEEAGIDWTDDEMLASAIIGAVMGYVRSNSPPSEEWRIEAELESKGSLIGPMIESAMGWVDKGEELPEGYLDKLHDIMFEVGTGFRDNELARRAKRIKGMEKTGDLMDLFKIKPGQPVDD